MLYLIAVCFLSFVCFLLLIRPVAPQVALSTAPSVHAANSKRGRSSGTRTSSPDDTTAFFPHHPPPPCAFMLTCNLPDPCTTVPESSKILSSVPPAQSWTDGLKSHSYREWILNTIKGVVSSAATIFGERSFPLTKPSPQCVHDL